MRKKHNKTSRVLLPPAIIYRATQNVLLDIYRPDRYLPEADQHRSHIPIYKTSHKLARVSKIRVIIVFEVRVFHVYLLQVILTLHPSSASAIHSLSPLATRATSKFHDVKSKGFYIDLPARHPAKGLGGFGSWATCIRFAEPLEWQCSCRRSHIHKSYISQPLLYKGWVRDKQSPCFSTLPTACKPLTIPLILCSRFAISPFSTMPLMLGTLLLHFWVF